MSTIVVGEIPASQFALADTFETVDGVSFESERVVENGDNVLMPIIWAQGDDLDREDLDSALEADDSVGDYSVLADFQDEWLYRMEWVRQSEFVINVLLGSDGTILDAHGNAERWRFRALYPERDALGEMTDLCEEYGFDFEMLRVREMDGEPTGRFGLTDEQYSAIMTAWEEGYYDVPQESQLVDISEGLDISHQALSERLRRGQSNLIEQTLSISGPE